MAKLDRDLKIVLDFINVYCKNNHQKREKALINELDVDCRKNLYLCDECADLASYAVKKRKRCPKNPKPTCRSCDTHCYAPKYRQKIREVMKYSGIYFIKKGRIDYLFHYLK